MQPSHFLQNHVLQAQFANKPQVDITFMTSEKTTSHLNFRAKCVFYEPSLPTCPAALLLYILQSLVAIDLVVCPGFCLRWHPLPYSTPFHSVHTRGVTLCYDGTYPHRLCSMFIVLYRFWSNSSQRMGISIS
jgi:hypothetical protein